MGLDFVENDATFEHAVTCAEFGKFHYYLLTVCGLIYADLAIGVTIISFVLPSAECDFQLTSSDKGWLNASPMFGMLLGSYFWGCLADTQGRKVVLVAALLMDGVFGLLSSISQFSSLFMICRFFNGFGIAGAMGICFPYLGEFQPTEFREKVLSWMELFWTFGIILLPVIAWLIIPLQIPLEVAPYFKFASWNLFIVVCSIPSLVLAGWLCFFPESPKFYYECGEHEKALDVLRHVFSVNTDASPDEFPVANLRERAPRVSIISIQSKRSVRSVKSVKTPKDVKLLLREVGYQTLELFYPPYRKNTILACLIQFGITSSYYTLMLWFPELFNRFDHYEKEHPNTSSVSVCEVSSVYVSSNTSHTMSHIDHCTEIDSSVFSHTLIIGLACIPTSLWLPLCVHKLGAKFFLVFCMLVSGGVTVGLYFVQTAQQNLLLSCIFEALTSLGISVVYCIMVDLFPTNLRVMAAALSATIGRVGALLGNLVFGFLIDTFCVIPIMLMAALLFMSGILALALPATGKEDLD